MVTKTRVISIFSTKGGVGKTLIAANLAALLHSLLGSKTAILPLDPMRDDPGSLLGPATVHRVTEPVTLASLPDILELLSHSCSYIVIDAGSVFSELAVTAFEHSNLILLITTPDVVSLQHTTRAIELLTALKFPLKMVDVVINRAESHGHVRSKEIHDQLPVAVIAELPSDGRTVGLSVNQGVPFMLSQNGTRIQDAFRRFARFLIDNPGIFVEHVTIDHAKMPTSAPQMITLPAEGSAGDRAAIPEDPLITLKRRIQAKLVERFDLKRLDLKTLNDPQKAKQLKEQTERVALDLLAEEQGFVAGREQRLRLIKEIVDDALALGPLEDLLADPEVSDILVNGKDKIYIEKRGRLSLTDKKFVSNDQVLTVIERIIAPLGRRIDESAPMVDARLPDGSRVNAIIPPLSLRGPMLSIRKFSRERYTVEDLIRFGSLSRSMADFLAVCVRFRKNLVVSGGTGSGKTTILNALSSFIPQEERIVSIEDAAELRLDQEHWVPLEARQANIEGKGAVTIRQLFRNTLRMRPDRIVIGECRGDETFDMLQAMNTGHDGSMTTLHANSPQDVISRLDSLVLMSNVELPVRAIREQVASAVHLVVHSARFPDGSRKITHITELTGMDEHDGIIFRDLFVFRQEGLGANGEVAGVFTPTGQAPTFLEDLKTKGIQLDEAMFRNPEHADPTHP